MFLRKIKSFSVEVLYSLQEGKQAAFASRFSDLGFENREHDQENVKSQINSIMALLRKTPWWAKGHLRLGWLALSVKEFDLAFASFEAVRRLITDENLLGNANIGLARCCMARGQHDKAIDLIKKLPEDFVSEDYINEQLAACYMAQERYDQAKSAIEKIPKSRRSPQVSGVLDYIYKQS